MRDELKTIYLAMANAQCRVRLALGLVCWQWDVGFERPPI